MDFKDGLIGAIVNYLENKIVQDKLMKEGAAREILFSHWEVKIFKVNYDDYDDNFEDKQLTNANHILTLKLDLRSMLYTFADFDESKFRIDNDFDVAFFDYSKQLHLVCKHQHFSNYGEIDKTISKLKDTYFKNGDDDLFHS